MHFRAFLNSMTDNYNPEWGGEKYVGRGDTLYKYGGFTRTVNFILDCSSSIKPRNDANVQKT